MHVVFVALGGALGSIARYVLSGAVHLFLPPTFPYGTAAVNVVGCLIFGILVGASEQRLVIGSSARSFLLIGLLGGFTTFSTFTFETFGLLRDGEYLPAAANVLGQVGIGLLVLVGGVVVGRWLWG